MPSLVLALIVCFLPAAYTLASSKPTMGIDRDLAELPNMVIHERVERYAGAGAKSRRLDTLTTTVEVVGHLERYSGIRRDGRELAGPREAGGLWSFGEMATLLEVTRDALRTMPGVEAANSRYFRFPASSRRWYVEVDSRIWWLDFEARVTMCPETGEIERILWSSSPLPPEAGIGAVNWAVDFLPVAVAGKMLTLPAQAVYRVTRAGRGNRAEWNVTTFAKYERYGSSATLSFGESSDDR